MYAVRTKFMPVYLQTHYYQPMFTLVGAGIKKLKDTHRPMASVLPQDAEWIKDSVQQIEPQGNYVMTQNGIRINYEYLVVAAGLKVDYNKVYNLIITVFHIFNL